MSDGMPAPLPVNDPAGALTSNEVGRKKPIQGKFKSGTGPKPQVKIDTNKHGIRRETVVGQKKTRPKKV